MYRCIKKLQWTNINHRQIFKILCPGFTINICNNDLLTINRNIAESCCFTGGFDSVSILLLAMICSVSREGSLSQYLTLNLSLPSPDIKWINFWFMTLFPAVFSFWLWFVQFQQKTFWIMLLTCFSCFLFFKFDQTIFCLLYLHLQLVNYSVKLSYMLSQIAAACSKSWYWAIKFWVTSFWCYNHWLDAADINCFQSILLSRSHYILFDCTHIFYYQLDFILCKAEQPLRYMELQEKKKEKRMERV